MAQTTPPEPPTREREPLYRRVAARIEGLVAAGTLQPGDRIPSIRKLSTQLSVSVSTVLEAYRVLEDRGVVEARPQSGYYVRPRRQLPAEPRRTEGAAPTELAIGDLILRIVREANQPGIVPLGAATGSSRFFPATRLGRLVARVARENPDTAARYGPVSGADTFRKEIARRALEAGCSLAPTDVVATAGCQMALHLCLRAVTRPGDTVAIESPTYYGLLEAMELLQLKALEIATHPRDGICLSELEAALAGGHVRACALVPNFGNPLGHRMPDDAKRALADLLVRYDVPLIEDDINGDLSFEGTRPKAVKAFDTTGRVLWCSSFSKTLAPGLRVGWTAPGRYRQIVERLKFSSSVATATTQQLAIASFLASGGFDRHLRRLRRTYADLTRRFQDAITEHFPEGTRISRPQGGHVLWVELPPGADALDLHDAALAIGVSIAPGPIFSANRRYRQFLRLNCAVDWTDDVPIAIARLGELVHRHLDEAGRKR